MYPEMFRKREELAMEFCSMRQPGGIGTKVEWYEPSDYIESIFGFRRYFTLENNVCRALFDLANSLPQRIQKQLAGVRVVRRDREQNGVGALQSALYAAAFSIQAQNMRAACNHVIQSPEGTIAKEFQRALWDEQPTGVNSWIIRVFNMHDELLNVNDGSVDTTVIRDRIIGKYKEWIPLLQWDWNKMNYWSDK
jgi:hypothetical protein